MHADHRLHFDDAGGDLESLIYSWCKLFSCNGVTRARCNSRPARPYIARLRVFNLLICPFGLPVAPRFQRGVHYTRDVTFREDASRIYKNPGIFVRMRSFTSNILRSNQSDTIPRDRYATALGGLDALFALRFSIER
jgi:hypothetical protein